MHCVGLKEPSFSKLDFIARNNLKLFRFFFSLSPVKERTITAFMCFADYWQTLSFWQIILIRLSQIVNTFEFSLSLFLSPFFSCLPFDKHLKEYNIMYTHFTLFIYVIGVQCIALPRPPLCNIDIPLHSIYDNKQINILKCFIWFYIFFATNALFNWMTTPKGFSDFP